MSSCFRCGKSPEPQEGPRPQSHRRHQGHRGNHRHRHHVQRGHSGCHTQHRCHEPQGHYEHEEYYRNQVIEFDQRQQQYQGEQEPEHNEEYELDQLCIPGVRTLQEVGYEVSDPAYSRHPTSSKEMMLYEISYPAANTRDCVIAIFGTWEDSTQL